MWLHLLTSETSQPQKSDFKMYTNLSISTGFDSEEPNRPNSLSRLLFLKAHKKTKLWLKRYTT